jgi:hypothetical protein
MAEAKRTTTTQEVVVKKTCEAVQLTLSVDEAQTLIDVLAKVGGDPARSRRFHSSTIYDALRRFGMEYTWAYDHSLCDCVGTLTFDNKD